MVKASQVNNSPNSKTFLISSLSSTSHLLCFSLSVRDHILLCRFNHTTNQLLPYLNGILTLIIILYPETGECRTKP